MALSTQNQGLTAEEQVQFDQMRDADAAPQVVEPEAPVVEEPQVDEAAAAEVAETPERRQTMVPHAALHEERERRKASDARLALLEERTNLLLQNIGRAPQPVAAPDSNAQPEIVVPDERADPVGHIIAKLQVQERELQTLRGGSQQQREAQQQAMVINAIQTQARALEGEFKQATPDYDAAIEFLVAKDSEELKALGYTDPAQRDAIIRQKGLQIAADAIQNRANPAERLYAIAKLRGFTGTPAAEETEQTAQNGAAQRIATIANGQRQSRTLSGARGAAPQAMTASRLLEMSDADFSRALENPENMGLLGA